MKRCSGVLFGHCFTDYCFTGYGAALSARAVKRFGGGLFGHCFADYCFTDYRAALSAAGGETVKQLNGEAV